MDAETKHERGKGRGRLFFALDRDLWLKLWALETVNRLNFVIAYLVLLAGTGADHRLSKWSAKAIEVYVGIGKPRGQRAIQELIDHGLVAHTEKSTRMAPQYRLPPLDPEADPIFLPVQLITGLASETPVLRRIRETGDPLMLRMLVDLYGQLQTDATYAVPLSVLSMLPAENTPARKILETGVNAVWRMQLIDRLAAEREWTRVHYIQGETTWDTFWGRVKTLRNMGILEFEPWIFDGPDADAEPLFPVTVELGVRTVKSKDAEILTDTAMEAVIAIARERQSALDSMTSSMVVIPLPLHHRAPEIRGVAKLRVEADTPGRRMAYALRMQRIDAYTKAFRTLAEQAEKAIFNRPLSPIFPPLKDETADMDLPPLFS